MIGLNIGTVSNGLALASGSSVSALTALRFFDDKVPNEEALALSPIVGWLMLAGAVAIASMLIANAEAWRRWWLTRDDPRSVGLWRIVFGFFIIANVNDLYEYFDFLFTDEGIFTSDVARQVHASAQFGGFGDGFGEDDPWGFFDVHGFLEFLKGPRYSLLYFWDSPTFFYAHLAAFEICGLLFMVGFFTRTFGVLTFFLMNSIFFRNHLFWEGTELVYRVFFAYLVCARSGHAYSVDNWLRCRRLRRKGLLSTREGPGGGAGVPPSDEHPRGLQAIYRRIPAWPRRLAILQLAVVYAFTGMVKNGSVWARGDAIYYAWNMDHFYRFYPQKLSAMIGTNILRLATWSTHWGESLMFLSVLGILIHFAHREGLRTRVGWRLWVTRAGWASVIGVSAAIIWVTWPVHFTPPVPRVAFVTGFVVACTLAWAAWLVLGRRTLHIRGVTAVRLGWVGGLVVSAVLLYVLYPVHAVHPRALVAARIATVVGWVLLGILGPWALRKKRRKPLWSESVLGRTYAIDQLWVARWLLGRRIWITFHVCLMGGIFVLMNIGQFQTGMLSQTFAFFTGLEVALALRLIGRHLPAWIRWIPKDVRAGQPPIPEQDPALPELQKNPSTLPAWSLYLGLAIVLVGVLVRVRIEPNAEDWDWRWIWAGGLAMLATVAFVRARTSKPEAAGRPRDPWAYGPLGRFLISTLLCWQIIGVAVWLLPAKDSLGKWRPAARHVFAKWLTVTQTDQGWGMFAPNPPRSNVFLKVLVTDQNDEVYDLKTDVYSPERKPIPWIWNDRMRKMNRRIIGGESGNSGWYRKWYARYICRDWALAHAGQGPKKVDLVKVWYKIPTPEEVAHKGWYDPEELYERTKAEKIEYTEHCQRTVMGQLPDWVRKRHGLPPLADDWKYRPWLKHKRKKWERKRAKQRGEDPAKTARAKVD